MRISILIHVKNLPLLNQIIEFKESSRKVFLVIFIEETPIKLEGMAINNCNLWVAQFQVVLRPETSHGIEDNFGANYPFFIYEMLTV